MGEKYKNDAGLPMIRLRGASDGLEHACEARQSEAHSQNGGDDADSKEERKPHPWLLRLPPDTFLPSEVQLREALLDFMASWSGECDPLIRHLCQTAEIKRLRKELDIPEKLDLGHWIEMRIGGEIGVQLQPEGGESSE